MPLTPFPLEVTLFMEICFRDFICTFLWSIFPQCFIFTNVFIYSQENPALPLQEALRLTIEACRVWIVCLRFGLETERFLEFYPIIMNHVKFLNTNFPMVSVCFIFFDIRSQFRQNFLSAIAPISLC